MAYYYYLRDEGSNPGNDMEAMKIRFGGGNEIDANTLINSLIHFSNIVHEVNGELAKDLNIEQKVEIKIKANEPGSFLVDMGIVASNLGEVLKGLFTKDAISYAANLVKTVGGVYNVAQLLKGKKPKEVVQSNTGIQITTSDGNVTNYNFKDANFNGATIYFNNPTVQTAIAKEFETLNADDNVSSFELLDKSDSPIAKIDRSEFEELAEPEPEEVITDGENTRVVTVNATLQIKAQDWTFRKAWDFYKTGIPIKAKIKDDEFVKKVLDRQEAFYAGDSLDVLLDITQYRDQVVDVWVDKSYSVKKIVKHYKSSRQTGIF